MMLLYGMFDRWCGGYYCHDNKQNIEICQTPWTLKIKLFVIITRCWWWNIHHQQCHRNDLIFQYILVSDVGGW